MANGSRPLIGVIRSSCSRSRPPPGCRAGADPLWADAGVAVHVFRGAAYPTAADLAGAARTGLEVQLCGDAHLSNFGVFAGPDRRLVSSINDFGEAPHRAAVPGGSNAQAVIKRLNPIIRGWAAYYRTQVSSDVFNALDRYLWRLTYKWARISHANKPKRWVVHRHYGPFNKARQDRWVFGDRQGGAYLHKFAWTRILRHRIVRHGASRDDPSLADYWAWRRRKVPLPINKTTQELIDLQDGRSSICGGFLLAVEDRPQSPRQWEEWLTTPRAMVTTTAARAAGTTEEAEPRLAHADCRRGRGPALHNAHEPPGPA